MAILIISWSRLILTLRRVKQLLSNLIQYLRIKPIFLKVPACLDFLIKVNSALNIPFQLWRAFKHKAEALAKEGLDALNVAIEVELSVEVRSRCHLREVNYCDLLLLANHEVELVEVSVDEPMLSKLDDLVD